MLRTASKLTAWRISRRLRVFWCWQTSHESSTAVIPQQNDTDRIQFEKRLWKMSKTGDIEQSLDVFKEMKSNEIELTHFALSSLLHCCLRSNKHSKKDRKGNKSKANSVSMYESIWKEFVCDHSVQPDAACYGLVIKAASECLHSDNVVLFGEEMKEKFGDDLNVRKWNGLISAFARIGDIEAMFAEFEAMKECGVKPDCFTISILFNALSSRSRSTARWRSLQRDDINSSTNSMTASCDRFEVLLNEVLSAESTLIDDYVFGGILDGLIQSGKPERVQAIWNRVVDGMGITPNVLCYALRIMAAAQCQDLQTVDSVIADLRASDLKMDRFCVHQILSAYGRLREFDKMWTEYNRWKERLRHDQNGNGDDIVVDIGSLSILSALEQRKEHRHKALDEAMHFVVDWNTLSRDRKKHFYRMSVIADHHEMQSMLWPLLESTKSDDGDGADDVVLPVHVEAEFMFEGRRYVLDNGHRQHGMEEEKEQLLYNEMTDALIQRAGHRVDTAKHPEIRGLDPSNHQLSDEHALKMLSYHAEKRALSFLVEKEKENKDIVIAVSMRMCSDCHQFFCCVSRLHPKRKIICIDPTKTHHFQKGICSCGRM